MARCSWWAGEGQGLQLGHRFPQCPTSVGAEMRKARSSAVASWSLSGPGRRPGSLCLESRDSEEENGKAQGDGARLKGGDTCYRTSYPFQIPEFLSGLLCLLGLKSLPLETALQGNGAGEGLGQQLEPSEGHV